MPLRVPRGAQRRQEAPSGTCCGGRGADAGTGCWAGRGHAMAVPSPPSASQTACGRRAHHQRPSRVREPLPFDASCEAREAPRGRAGSPGAPSGDGGGRCAGHGRTGTRAGLEGLPGETGTEVTLWAAQECARRDVQAESWARGRAQVGGPRAVQQKLGPRSRGRRQDLILWAGA